MRRLLGVLALMLFASPAFAQTGWRANWVPHGEVHAAVKALKKPLYRCYAAHVPAASRKHGDIATLRVVVSQAGNVFRVDFLEGSTRSKAFEMCLRELFQGLKFSTKPAAKMQFVQKIGFQNGVDKLTIEPPNAAGGAITRESVNELAKARQAEIQGCYTKALANAPGIRGQVLVEIVVDGTRGTVTTARVVKSTLQNAETESCVLNTVRSFAFPIPDDPGIVILQFPLTFDAG